MGLPELNCVADACKHVRLRRARRCENFVLAYGKTNETKCLVRAAGRPLRPENRADHSMLPRTHCLCASL